MTTIFQELWANAQSTLDVVFGDGFTLKPRIKADRNGPSAPDSGRAEASFIGSLILKPLQDHTEGRGKAGNWTTAVAGDTPMIACNRTDLPYLPKAGDHILRTDPAEAFTVTTSILPTDVGRLRIPVVRGLQ